MFLYLEAWGLLGTQVMRLLIPLVPGVTHEPFERMEDGDAHGLESVSDEQVHLVFAAAAERMRLVPSPTLHGRIETLEDAWSFFAFLSRNRGLAEVWGPLAAMALNALQDNAGWGGTLELQQSSKNKCFQLLGLLDAVLDEHARFGREQEGRRVWLPGVTVTDEVIAHFRASLLKRITSL